ncbi:precorrin-6A/cobalt-precorrin-6A reductase [Rhodobacteraceae bacterium KMM 6894]|nr:precorrin-6A/cobalt-precorrin-6A reductase [Rhodobacteraceae bacterium KMM 6894]
MTLLLLAGSGEARTIAEGLTAQGADAIVSYADARRAPDGGAIAHVTGGFGGADGFRRFVADRGITAVLDATHPFAMHISHRTARICAALGLPYALMLRPAWVPGPGDRWTFIEHEEEAAHHIAPDATVFLATGRDSLKRLGGLAGRRIYCRLLSAPDGPFPFAGGQFLVGKAPFSVADETALFQRLGIDWLMVKNAGGAMPESKLTAARDLGLRVMMINRPAPPEALTFQDAQKALDWALAL